MISDLKSDICCLKSERKVQGKLISVPVAYGICALNRFLHALTGGTVYDRVQMPPRWLYGRDAETLSCSLLLSLLVACVQLQDRSVRSAAWTSIMWYSLHIPADIPSGGFV